MRVLITRPEREATALAMALGERGHVPVIAPLFRLEILHPPADFAAALAACQAVLLTSANGARALAEASEQRSRPSSRSATPPPHRRGLGFSAVTSAAGDGAALADLVRQRLDPKDGPLLHVSGATWRSISARCWAAQGFEVQRFALYDAREDNALPDFGAGGAGGARARRRHLLLAARRGAVRPARRRSRPRRTGARCHRGRHQPGRAGAACRAALQGDRRGGAADPPGGAGRDRPAGRSRRTRTGDHDRCPRFPAPPRRNRAGRDPRPCRFAAASA